MLNERAPIGALVKTSLVDYPGRVSAALFLHGCNLRCPYCYNTDLVTGVFSDYEAVTFFDVLAHLDKRRSVISGFVISGGEPFLSPFLPQLIKGARALGYAVKLDTNGTFSEKFEELLADSAISPDFVALDVKTSPERYKDLLARQTVSEEHASFLRANILHSIRLVSALPRERREFRTVLVPSLVGEPEILAIATSLPSDADWFFAPFKNKNCIDPSFNMIEPYEVSETERLISCAQKRIPGAAKR